MGGLETALPACNEKRFLPAGNIHIELAVLNSCNRPLP